MRIKPYILITVILCCITLAAAACGKSNTVDSVMPTDGAQNAEPTGSASVTEASEAAATEAAATEAPTGKSYCIDYKCAYNSVTAIPIYAETDDALYYLADNMVYFSDKEYHDWMPLCVKPDCKHNNKDCNAYVDTESLILYDRYLYYIEGSGFHDEMKENSKFKVTLCRMNLDGTGHETVCELRDMLTPELGYTPDFANWSFYATDKYLIVSAAFGREGERVTAVYRYNYSFDLETLQAVRLFSEYGDPRTTKGFFIFEGEGSLAYGQLSYFDDTPTQIVEVDLATGTVRELCEFAGNIAYYEREVGIRDGKLYFCETDLGKGENYMYTGEEIQHLYELDLETCELELIDETTAIYSKYRVFDTLSGYWYSTIGYDGGDEKGTYICDIDRNEIAFLPASEYPEEMGGKILLGRITEDYIFAMPIDEDGFYFEYGEPLWYLCKADIGTDNLMWRKWEP